MLRKLLLFSILYLFFINKNTAQSCITISEPPVNNAGTATNISVCQANMGLTVVSLSNNIANEDSGGTWSLAPVSANPNAAFNSTNGSFNPNGVTNGIYIFRYTVGTMGCEDSEDISIVIQTCCPTKICLPVKITRH